jgi:peptidoglycan hydrolase-like protein with peptidoglycan-binding domain
MSLSNHSAFADQSSGIPPKLKPFNVLTSKLSRSLSRSAFKGLLGLAVLTGVLGMASKAEAYMHRGAVGPAVSDVQAALGIPADGVFGHQTQLAVMDFQRRACITVDGVVGPETLSALFGINTVTAAPVSSGYSGSSAAVPAGGTLVGTPVPNNILEPGIKPPSAVLPPAVTGPYVVVVPEGSAQRLASIQQVVPNAVIDGASRGSFINAGGYPNYGSAREVAGRLRGYGFDARVDYFERYESADDIPDDDGYTPCTPGTPGC